MIATVTLNAAIDKTYRVARLEPGKVQRVRQVASVPGGKGINVARAAHMLGAPVLATGIVSGSNGQFIAQQLAREGIPNDFMRVEAGESRCCLNILSEEDGGTTELLEPGPVLTEADAANALALVRSLARRAAVVCLSGSLPQGLSAAIYRDMIEAIRAGGALPFLDTSGPALQFGAAAKPYFMKPNADEIAGLLGRPPAAPEPAGAAGEQQVALAVEGVRQLMEGGVRCAAVTLGARGAVAGFGGKLYRVTAPAVEAVNAVGCGDAFVAGMAVAVREGQPAESCFRFATAVASASALTPLAGQVRIDDVRRLLPHVAAQEVG